MHSMVSMCASLNPAVSGPWGLSPLPRPLRAGLWAQPGTQQGHYRQAGPLGLQFLNLPCVLDVSPSQNICKCRKENT